MRVKGGMFREDAVLPEKIALEMRARTGKRITIDLAAPHFLDSDGAPILRRMTDEHKI